MTRERVIVIGAGVIGISIALALRHRGYCVRVFDRSGVAMQASAANAGAFGYSDIIPLARPGIMRNAPKWLLDPLGPLSVPPAYAPRILPWMLRFWRASRRDRYEHATTAQAGLMALSKAALERQIALVDGEALMQRDGQLQLYEGEKDFNASLEDWEIRRRHGIDFELLTSPEAIAEIQPKLNPRFTHAGFTPGWINTVDPKAWVDRLANRFRDLGGQIERNDVQSIAPDAMGARVTLGERTIEQAHRVVVAAGAWSHHLARRLGERIPLETERGYNTTLPAGAFDLRTQLTFGGHGFVVSRINGGVRVGGAVELGGLRRPPDFRRADILLRKAARFIADLKTEGGTQWMGFRPSLPDSLPVIGTSSKSAGIVYAFGHGHLGLTQSAGTAELVADIIDGKTPSIPLEPFSPARF